MLLLVTDFDEKRAAQAALERTVRAGMRDQGRRNIGFPSGNVAETVYSNGAGELWAAFTNLEAAAVPRRWNAFGVYDPKRQAQMITVEVNTPTTSNSAQVAGFFAKDAASGEIYLMHDGSVGGGKPGVGRNAFLAWTRTELVDVHDGEGGGRRGLIIGGVESADLSARLWRLVRLVKGFKDAVKVGGLDDPDMHRAIADWEGFNSENAGRRQGRRRSEIDYISYHGDVVECLFEERSARRTSTEIVGNSPLIDLYVEDRQGMTEIYEVKTSTDRQSLYTAIGQLLTHSTNATITVTRTLVVPEGPLPADLAACLASLAIGVRHFKLTSDKAPKVVLS